MYLKIRNFSQKNKMSILYKIGWRLKFILTQALGKNIDAIICSLRRADARSGVSLMSLLVKNKIIKWDNKNKIFSYKNYKFFYEGHPPSLDIISILSFNEDYIKRNFIQNSAYLFDGPYEKNGFVLSKGDYVIDAGANFGLFAIPANDKVGRSGKIFAFEPIKKTMHILKKNLVANKTKNVLPIPFALGQNNNILRFSVFKSRLEESSGFFVKNSYLKEDVQQITLDNFVRKNYIKKINFIKADIEGMERDLLKGAKNTIQKFKPKISICIYHRPHDPEVLERMIKNFVPDYEIFKTKEKLYAWI